MRWIMAGVLIIDYPCTLRGDPHIIPQKFWTAHPDIFRDFLTKGEHRKAKTVESSKPIKTARH